jgi:hypothetical protein
MFSNRPITPTAEPFVAKPQRAVRNFGWEGILPQHFWQLAQF